MKLLNSFKEQFDAKLISYLEKKKQYLTEVDEKGGDMVKNLRDDYEGTFGDDKITRKSLLSDVQEGKNTWIVELFKERANQKELQNFSVLFGKPKISSVDFSWYKKKLDETNIKKDIGNHIYKESEILRIDLKKIIDSKSSFSLFISEIISNISSI